MSVAVGAQQYRTPQQNRLYPTRLASIHSQQHYVGGSQEGTSDVNRRRTDLQKTSIISERVVEREVKVPKKVTREEVIEKVIIVPETIVIEEMIEEIQKIREKVVEVARPVVKETYVEVPEIVYVEKIVEVPEIVQRESIKSVPVVEYRDRVVEVPKVVKRERVVEVPEIEYREVPYEKIIEVPKIHEQVVVREVPVPTYVDKFIQEYITVNVPRDVVRHIPVPIAASTSHNYELPRPKPKYQTVDLNVYVPRFIEVPLPAEFMDPSTCQQAQMYIDQVTALSAQPATSLCEIENLAGVIKNSGIAQIMDQTDYSAVVMEAWRKGNLSVSQHPSMIEQQTQRRRERTERNRSTRKHK